MQIRGEKTICALQGSNKGLAWAVGLLIVTLLAGCGGGGNATVAPAPTPVSQVTSVVVSPATATTNIGESQAFTAKVSGTGNFSTAVTWLVNKVPGGNATLGTISTSGLYTAPAVVPDANPITITAVSVGNPALIGAAQDTLVSGITSISVNPLNLSMPEGQTQQYQAVVGGITNQSVNWSLTPIGIVSFNPGSIDVNGLYTAPSNLTSMVEVNVTATSVVDRNATTSAAVLVYPPPTITQITPDTADAGDTITIQGTDLAFIRSVRFTGPNNVPLDAVLNGSGVQFAVPLSAMSGPITIIQQLPGFPPSSTQTVAFTRLPRLRIRAGMRDLSAGESTSFQLRVLGQPGPQTIDWSADLGNVDPTGIYTAPGALTGDAFATVTACIAGTQICDSEILGLHPFRIDPGQPLVPLGGTIQLNAISGGGVVGADFSQVAGGGSISTNGLYTAGSLLTDAGSASILGTFGGSSQSASIGVTGGFPGLIARLSDYRNFINIFPVGTVDASIALVGNRAYVAASNLPPGYVRNQFWIDVYDFTDPIHPVWLDAVEAAADGDVFTDGTFLYQIAARDDSPGLGFPMRSVAAIFNISGPQPVLMDRRFVPGIFFFNFSNGIAYALPDFLSPAPMGTLYQFDLTGGSVSERDLHLAVNGSPVSVFAGISVQNRLFASFAEQNSSQGELGVFDLTVDPPAFLGSVPANATNTENVTGNLLLAGPGIYDISGALPILLGSFPSLTLTNSNGTLVFADTFQAGSRVLDISTPTQPKLTEVFGEVGWGSPGRSTAWAGNLLIRAEQAGGLAIYDPVLPGGPVERALLPGTVQGSFASVALDQAITGTNLFVATATDTVGVVNVYDLTSVPPVRTSSIETGTQTPVALDVSGNTLFVGTDASLLVFDATNPATPTQVSSLPLASVTSLAHKDSTLFVGTLDDHLLVFDISQPAAPVQQLSILLPGVADKLAVTGNLLVVADDTAGLLLYDVTAPSSPAPLAQLATPDAAADVSIDGSLALLAAASAGLVIVDISNPSAPAIISQTGLDMPVHFGSAIQHNFAASIATQGSIAYLGTVSDNDTMFAFDYSQPAHPRLVSLASYIFSVAGGIGFDGALLTLRATGNSLFIGGFLEFETPVVQADITQPRNVINLYLPPSALLPVAVPGAAPARTTAVMQPGSMTPAQWRTTVRKRLKK